MFFIQASITAMVHHNKTKTKDSSNLPAEEKKSMEAMLGGLYLVFTSCSQSSLLTCGSAPVRGGGGGVGGAE